MKEITITLIKEIIHDFIDKSTFKRTDATLDQTSERSQNAVSSDATEDIDGTLIATYCDRRDARLRDRLKFCLISDTGDEMSFSNVLDVEPAYVYKLKVDDNFTADSLRSIGTKMNEYIVRGAILDWYLNSGLQPTDSEGSLQILEDDIVYALRGQAWGKKPLQPFGPALFNYQDPHKCL